MNRVLRLLVLGLTVTWSLSATAQDKPAETPATTDNKSEEKKEDATVAASSEDVEEEAEEETEEKAEDAKDWAVSVSLSSGIGQGTFASVSNDTEFADEVDPGDNAYDRWNLALSLSPSYTIADLISVSASIAWTQQMLAGGGINEPNELRFQDVGLGIDWAGHSFKSTGINVSAGLGFALPTSDTSQTSSLYVGTSLGGNISYKLFDKVNLSYSLGISKDFHEFTSPIIDEEEVGAENLIWRAGGSERVGDGIIAIDGVNTEWAVSNSISASMPVWDKLRLSASYSFSTFWTYDVLQKDEFSFEEAEEGRGVGQGVSTSVSLSYPFLDYFSASAGIRTSVQPKTADNRSFNFPFWNMDGAASNASQIRLGLSASY